MLQNHDTIGLNRTKTPVEFARVLDVLDKLSASLRGDGKGNGPMADVVNSSAAIADGNGQQMKDALGELSNALRLSSDRGAVTRDQLTTIIRNLSSLTDGRRQQRCHAAGVRLDRTATQPDSGRRESRHRNDRQEDSTRCSSKWVRFSTPTVTRSSRSSSTAIPALTTTVDHQRDLAEFLDLAPMTLDNLYNIVDQKNGSARVHVLTDKVLFETQAIKEMCNMMGLRQLGCSTGTLQDFGPDFGLSYVLDGLAAMGQK